ncbi:phosphoglycolate phosphatase [Oceanicola granulosus HTCC2516]|uniref:phosphoglycolate phosphatase n=1 Tax=Oceanicola granulosus (strain ATCC BAA-861 / DSM 15982 / KCTC 12143 / HTCC2516) TaxID=314256 RepID=Q2CIZ6_OCEGH|nr:HAD-IA family hydrolase [Oceanicola granulosus]EAR52804.1 phosphoglycolate phosphatase [Oceanicola granulosus HTCC2516]
MRTVIFDLDGTLVDSSADLIAAANHCFRARGLGDLLDPAADAETAFHGGRAMLTLGFSRVDEHDKALVEEDYPRLLEAYGARIARHTTLYPGAMEAVGALVEAGYGVGICTNKPEALAEKLLAELGVREAFGAMVGADTLAVRKPDPEPFHETVRRLGGTPGRTCLVGDTETDRLTAQAAKVPSVLVTFGPAGETVAQWGPDAVIGAFGELVEVVEGLGL